MNVTARARRSGGWWAVEVPEVPGVFTQARRLDQVAAAVTDAVRTFYEDDTLNVQVSLVPHIDDRTEQLTTQAQEATRAQEEAAARQRAAMRDAVRALRDAGLPTRDVATLLGISHQRVSQITAEAAGSDLPKAVS